MTKSPGIALYNQDRFDDAEFVCNFVARNEQAEALLNGLRHIAEGGPTEHQILVGARGMGKTSLLRRLAIGIMDDPALKTAFIPLRFREEQYNVISLDGFWRNCGESLAEWCEQQGNQALADRLDIAIETPEWRDDDRARDAFLAACNEAGGRAILLLDNLNLILEGIKPEGCWSLRAALQERNGPIVIGATTQLLAQGADREAPFYEFFNPHMLEPLTERELLACLNALATQRGEAGGAVRATLAREPERMRALYVLTGGNPRILGFIYGLLEQADSDEIFADLEALLDQVTPFYKARIEEYQTALQRAVIDGIALHWDPITSGALSRQTGIEATTLSAQLIRLKKDGLIEEVETSGARAGYQLAERFLNIWYLMRHGTRKTKQRLRWFTIFLTKLFSADELRMMAGEAQGGTGKWRADYCEAVLEAYGIKLQNEFEKGEISETLVKANDIFSKALSLYHTGQWQDAIAAYDDGIARLAGSDAAGLQPPMAMALVNKGVALAALSRSEDEIAVYDDVIGRFGASDAVGLQEQVARALVYKGITLNTLGRSEDEIAIYDDVVARFGTSDAAGLQEQVARALFNKGITLGALGRSEDAIASYDDLVARFGTSDAAGLQEQVAKALFNKSNTLGALNRFEEEIAVYDDVVARFGASDAASLQEPVARALANKGFRLGALGRSDEEVAVYDDIVARLGASDTPDLKQLVAIALFNKGVRLGALSRFEHAIAVYDNIVARFGASDAVDLQEQVAMALVNKGFRLGALGRSEEEIAVYDDVVARFGVSDAAGLQKQVASALVNKGFRLGALGRSEEEIVVYDDVVARFGASDAAGLQEQVANATVAKATHLFWNLGRTQAADAAMREVLETDRDNLMANANLLWMLVAMGRQAEASALMDELDAVTGGGRALMRAGLDLGAGNFGKSFDHLSDALDQGLSGEFDFSEDLLWYLRIAEERGHGERLIAWFDESGNADRYAPVYGAFVAHVRGERFLLDLNPEVRGVARPLYAKLSAGKARGAKDAEPKQRARKARR